ncbi:hypothetical protein ACN6LL_003893, partial [Streptomyces violaceoruber]
MDPAASGDVLAVPRDVLAVPRDVLAVPHDVLAASRDVPTRLGARSPGGPTAPRPVTTDSRRRPHRIPATSWRCPATSLPRPATSPPGSGRAPPAAPPRRAPS